MAYQTIALDSDGQALMWPVTRFGIRLLDLPQGRGISLCFPIMFPPLVAFLLLEGGFWWRRRKHKVDAAPDAGIADGHE